jgi:hypothetical protein
MMPELLRDLRLALRSLLKSPGFALITVLTLALGIGANTAIFSVVNAVLLRPLPFREPDRLIVVRETYGGGAVGTVSGPNFVDWRDRSRSFESLTASRGTSLALAGEGEPEELRGARVSAEFFRVLGVREVDREQPISRLREAGELLSDAVARQRFSMLLLVLFGGLALTLAAIGVYGVMAYAVSQRTRELGIRLALGARTGSVRALVLRQGLGIALLGVGFGLGGALALGRLLTSLLYDVSPADPRVLAVAALTLSAVSALASLVPAIRATRVDPIDALRSE